MSEYNSVLVGIQGKPVEGESPPTLGVISVHRKLAMFNTPDTRPDRGPHAEEFSHQVIDQDGGDQRRRGLPHRDLQIKPEVRHRPSNVWTLTDYQQAAHEPDLLPRESYTEVLQAGTEVLNQESGLLKFENGYGCVVVADVHGRREMVANVLSQRIPHPDTSNPTSIWDVLNEGKVNLIFVGDYVHTETADNWIQPIATRDSQFSFSLTPSLSRAEARDSLGVVQLVLRLKQQFRQNVCLCKGNHDRHQATDSLAKRVFFPTHPEEIDSELAALVVPQSLLFKEGLQASELGFDSLFFQRWLDWEAALPLMGTVKLPNDQQLVITHGGIRQNLATTLSDANQSMFGRSDVEQKSAQAWEALSYDGEDIRHPSVLNNWPANMQVLLGEDVDLEQVTQVVGHRRSKGPPHYYTYAVPMGGHGSLYQICNPDHQLALYFPPTFRTFNPEVTDYGFHPLVLKVG